MDLEGQYVKALRGWNLLGFLLQYTLNWTNNERDKDKGREDREIERVLLQVKIQKKLRLKPSVVSVNWVRCKPQLVFWKLVADE